MAFFRNLRSSIARGRSTSRDTTPISSLNSSRSSSNKRRDSIESCSASMFNRSDTFILDDPNAKPCHSNCSTLEKKTKKSKVLEKFSTFTRRKKKPPSESATFEHHPSDNATNTYYKWQADGGGNSLDYDSQNDPFNVLYDQHSSLKSLNTVDDSLKLTSSLSSGSFDSSTYRKGKMPTDLKKQLRMFKDQDINNQGNYVRQKVQEVEDEVEEQADENFEEKKCLKTDKYKTVTLNSFRKSFREKFLQQQKEAAHNPTWFVEVEKPEEETEKKHNQRDVSSENRRDLLIFENENYRPNSRSPIRELNNRKEARTCTRSPVKRNETFRVERLSRFDQQANKSKAGENTASIHIEFKNSITPHIPGRLVPVGVAKPMPSQLTYANYCRPRDPIRLNETNTTKSYAGTTKTRLNSHSPIRSPWLGSQSPTRTLNSNSNRLGCYQTLVQIKNEKSQLASPITVRNSRLSTRIQLESNTPTKQDRKTSITSHSSPSLSKRYNSPQLLGYSGNKAQPIKQTYFGETPQTARITQIPSNLSSSTSGLRAQQVAAPNFGGYKNRTPSLFASVSSLAPSTIPLHSVHNIHSSSNNNLSQMKHYQQHEPIQQQQKQTRFLVAGQRRSRSPIKVPWR